MARTTRRAFVPARTIAWAHAAAGGPRVQGTSSKQRSGSGGSSDRDRGGGDHGGGSSRTAATEVTRGQPAEKDPLCL